MRTKVRVAFDASSFAPGQNFLKECLDKGIDLDIEAIDLLLRFKANRNIMTADIQKAFLQIEVRVEEFRFLVLRFSGFWLSGSSGFNQHLQ